MHPVGDTMNLRSTSPSRGRGQDEAERDQGTALLLVLLLVIIGSLLAIPLARYSTTVLRANTVLTAKTKRVEAVKAGLRIALADPARLYEACGAAGPTVPVALAPTTANDVGVTTSCYYIDHQAAQAADQLRFGLTATRAGATPPLELSGSSFSSLDPSDTREWWASATKASETDKIWLPDLPTHGLNRRSSAGTTMPAGFPACRVYFPGTYPDPVVLDGPTYFTSGIYYFESEVRVVGGADVVVGLGAAQGCTSDQEAIFYAQNPPGTHNMSGLGATWVLGGRARVVVSNSNALPISLRFNARYVAPDDLGAAPSADVSIVSVNGELDVDGTTGIDLNAPGIIEVPVSTVGGTSPVVATVDDYLPSVFTPKPVAPDAPSGVTAERYVGAAVASWTAPFDGGSPITSYVVTASGGQPCTTSGATTCAFVGLPNSAVTFTVVARTAAGDSVASQPSTAVTPGGSTTPTKPGQPARPSVTPYRRAARVTWTAPTNSVAPITSYTVTSSPGGTTCALDVATATTPPLQCDFTELDPLTAYTFTVVATNAVGASTASLPNSVAVVPILGLGQLPVTAPPVAPVYEPTPIVDFDVPGPADVTVSIPGYIAIPQGRLRVDNPRGFPVVAAGGVLAAQFSINDGRATGPNTVAIGFLESVVQRKFRIVSTTVSGRETSTAVVQVNQNGAYAVNSWEVQ